MTDGLVRAGVPGSEAYAASLAFFEHSVDGVLFTAPDGRILDANDAACAMLRMSRDEVCRRGRAGLADPADPRWVVAVEVRARTGRFLGPLSLLRGDGTALEAVVSSAVFADAAGEPRTVVVMRAAEESREQLNAAVIDGSGIANKPAFVFLAEQQCRKAIREHVGIGLVYARVVELEFDDVRRPPTEDDLGVFASLFAEDCGWGDVVGRVGERDFAILLTADDAAEYEEVASSIQRRVSTHNRRAIEHFHVHLGAMETTPTTRVVELLDDASATMREHESHEHPWTSSGCCVFSLRQPATVLDALPPIKHSASELTARELAVLRLLARRRSYAEIAEALFISINTVKTHATHVYTKLGVTNRNDAMIAARRAGLLTRPDIGGRAAPAPGEDARPVSSDGSPTRSLARLVHALANADDTDDALDLILAAGSEEFEGGAGIVVVIDDDHVTPVATLGYADDAVMAFFPAPLKLDLPITDAARECRTVCVENRDQLLEQYPEVAASPVARSSAWITAPLVERGRCIGALGLSLLTPHAFSTAEREFVKSLADLCVLTLHSAARDVPAR